MNKVKRRVKALWLLILLTVAGLAVFTGRLLRDGGDWAASTVNGNAYRRGRILYGTVTDRNGVPLLTVRDGACSYSDDETIRLATLHAVGDWEGNIGSGAVRCFRKELAGYDMLNGLYQPERVGGTVTLSLDASLCAVALEALAGRRGAVAVMNYETGEILCSVSSPGFDPLSEEPVPGGAYMDRVLSALYAPGSVFKLATLAAAIERLDGVFDREFHCEGKRSFSGSTVTCVKAHGDLKLEDALAVSCNCVFAELAVELGAEAMEEICEALGLTRSASVDGVSTAAGRYDGGSDAIALAWSGAGQYRDMVNPAGILRMVSAIANGGVFPGFTRLKDGETEPERLLSEETAARIGEMMSYNVYLTYGEANYPGLKLHAKSGTAEVGGGKSPTAWFTGFITNEGAPLAFVVVVEEGGWGSQTAGFVTNMVLQAAVFGV